VSVLAGAIGGGVEAVTVWPMEYIKTQLQLQSKAVGDVPKFHGIIGCARYTIQTHGFFAFYRGLGPILAFSIPKAGIRFGGYKYFANMFQDPVTGKVSIYGDLVAGTLAGVTEALLAVTPMETLKTRLIDGNKPFIRGTIDIIKTEGLPGVYKGVTATALKQGSNQGLRFMFFGQYKKFITIEGPGLTPLQGLVGGMGAGCFSCIINNPFDAVKTRMQGLNAKKYTSTIDCFKKMGRQEGISSFYRGVLARMGRVVPGQGILFMTADQISQQLEKLMEKEQTKLKPI